MACRALAWQPEQLAQPVSKSAAARVPFQAAPAAQLAGWSASDWTAQGCPACWGGTRKNCFTPSLRQTTRRISSHPTRPFVLVLALACAASLSHWRQELDPFGTASQPVSASACLSAPIPLLLPPLFAPVRLSTAHPAPLPALAPLAAPAPTRRLSTAHPAPPALWLPCPPLPHGLFFGSLTSGVSTY